MSLQDYIGEATAYDKKLLLERKDPTSWLKSVSAFANAQGGRLLFGVGDGGEPVGLADAQGDAEAISETVKAQMDPVPEIDLAVHEEDGRRYVVVEVKAGTETPYYLFAKGHRDAYVRIGNESVKADAVQLKRLVLKGTKCSWDSLASPHGRDTASFEVLRAVYYRKTKRKFAESDFVSFGLVAGGGRLTNAGALFADGPLVRHSRVFCTRWNGRTKAHGTLDAHDDDEFTGGLLSLLEAAKGFVKANSRTPWRKLPSGEGRVDYPEYPPDAVEECIVNALIHRDYLELGSEVHIDIFDDRLEVYSPGGMPTGERIQDLDASAVPSTRRNPVIADLFQRLGLMERRGSGFGKILDAYRRESEKRGRQTVPSFRSSATGFFAVLPNLNCGAGAAAATTAPTTAPTTATATAPVGMEGTGSVAETLGKDTARVYRLISQDGRITAGDMAARLRLTEAGVRYHLKKIKMAGFARYEGNAMSGGRWVVAKR